MKSVRIYKDDIRVHILRSLFFTDTVLVVIGALAITGLIYFIFHSILGYFNWGYFISSLIVSVTFFVAFITQKIDNQPISQVLPRMFKFHSKKKQERFTDLDEYFTDFSIQDHLIIRKNSVIRMYEIEPFDVALLNEQDRENFFIKLKQALHILPSSVQFIVRKEQAKPKDCSKHFFSLYSSSNKRREPLISQYIENLTSLVETEQFLITKHYAVFSVPCNSAKPNEKVTAVKKLDDSGIRFASALSSCHIQIKPIDSETLKEFAKSQLR